MILHSVYVVFMDIFTVPDNQVPAWYLVPGTRYLVPGTWCQVPGPRDRLAGAAEGPRRALTEDTAPLGAPGGLDLRGTDGHHVGTLRQLLLAPVIQAIQRLHDHGHRHLHRLTAPALDMLDLLQQALDAQVGNLELPPQLGKNSRISLVHI